MQIPVTFSVHDYYSICPSTQLLDSNGVFCGGNCTSENGEDCQTQVGLVSPLPKLKNNYIYSWQSKMSQVIDTVDGIIAPSMAASKRLQSIYPHAGPKTQVVEHGRSDLVHLGIPSVKNSSHQQKKLIVIGHIGDHKGAKLLSQIIEPLDSLGVNVEVLGSVNWRLKGKVKVLGEYSREELPALVNKGGYSAALFLSIWEETYAHTLTEAWAAGIPTISLDLGAIGERTKATGNGIALAPYLIDRPQNFAKEIKAVLDDQKLQAKLKANLSSWSRTGVPSTKEMAKNYLDTWTGLLTKSR
jgi:glycosyltransferase involved in cell wall biosynthesis